jgi:hypothetical protein
MPVLGRSLAVSLLAAALAAVLAPAARADGDRRSDAPRAAVAPRAAAAAAGATSFTFLEAQRHARLRVDDGYELDQYRFGDQSPITFQIDLDGIDPTPVGSTPVVLRMYVFDVDQAGSEDCGPEVDQVSVNGKRVGTLTGADGQWSLNTFTLPPGTLTSGANGFRVDIDTGGTGCWAVQVDWAEVEVPFNLGETAVDATDDVTIRRGTTTTTIPDRVWRTEFDADGTLKPAIDDDPIADAMSDSSWWGLSSATGKFTYKYTLDAWRAKPNWKPTVKATYKLTGPAAGAATTVPDATGWDGSFAIDVPQKTGKYELTVSLEISKDGKTLRTEERTHKLYVLLGQPKGPGIGPKSPSADTATPKTAWLDRAFDWGASGQDKPEPILTALNDKIYSNPLGWQYVGGGVYHTAEQLIEGIPGGRGECSTFTNVWEILALSLGIDVDENYYGVFSDVTFVTKTKPALDKNTSANVSRKGGAAKERWLFGNHVWGTFAGKRYDPTFGFEGPDTTAAFKSDGVFCEFSDGICEELGASPPANYGFTLLPGTNTTGWPVYEYEPLPPTPLAALQQKVRPAAAAAALAPPTDSGVDADGNGQYELLRVDVPVTVAAAGDYAIRATLASGSGRQVATGTLNPSAIATPVIATSLPLGETTVPVYFRGGTIRAGAENGPYTVDVTVATAGGTPAGSTRHTTAAYDYHAFQGPIATPGSITDSAVDTDAIPGPDRLRASIPLNVSAAGRVDVKAVLLAGNTTLGIAERELDVTGSRTVELDFPTAPIWAAGADGPYTLRVSVDDAFAASRAEHTTAAYRAADLQPPNGYIAPSPADQARDRDNDGRSDTVTVTAMVGATVPGNYVLRGTLLGSDGTTLATASRPVAATTAPAPVALDFDVAGIVRRGADGPYTVRMSLEDSAGALQMARDHRTAAYQAGTFEPPAATLTGAYTDAAVDTNGDGHPDVLRVTSGVTVGAAGSYELSGVLTTAGGRQIAAATTNVQLPAGAGAIGLDFDGGAVRAGGVDGPFRLTGVRLGRSGDPASDVAIGAHTTAAYTAAQFRPAGAFFIERIADRGVDDDGDGRFDELAIDVVVNAHEEGSFFANARLVDARGKEIGWSGTRAVLDPGEHTMTLSFDGRLVSGRGVDGPYRVEDLSVYSDPTDPVTVREPYLTGPYQWQQFELGSVISGRVTSNGVGLAGAVIAVPGLAYDITDANGAYRLALGGGGTYEVTISADAALAPWRISVDGVQRALGTSVSATVADGATATVSFDRGGVQAQGSVGGTVPATLALSLGGAASFGTFTPGVAREYVASTTADVVSTAGDATLTVSDPGHLANGAFELPQPLRVEIAPASWSGPVSHASVAIAFRQAIGANDALRTGSYAKQLTFTLSTTNP